MALSLLGILSAAGAGGAGPSGGASYELIQSSILTSDTASVTFSSIPQTYKHLQIRVAARTTRPSESIDIIIARFNSDSGSNYSRHQLWGDGSSVSSLGAASQTAVRGPSITGSAATTNSFGVGVVDILDYASTSKNTTIRSLSGFTSASFNRVILDSGAWLNTAAVTSIVLSGFAGDSNFISGSRFSLYGIKG